MRIETKKVKEILKKQGIKASVKSYYKKVQYIYIDTIIEAEESLHIDIILNNPIRSYDEYVKKITLAKGYYNYIDYNIFTNESIQELIKLGF